MELSLFGADSRPGLTTCVGVVAHLRNVHFGQNLEAPDGVKMLRQNVGG